MTQTKQPDRASTTDWSALDRYIDDHMPAWTEELVELCRLASEETKPEEGKKAADWIARRLERLGATVDVVRLPGESAVPALVVGEIGDGPRTVNMVQHYDVQPAHPLELWTTPPYEPTVRDGRLFARGATDNKGELMSRIWGVEAYLAAIGPLPCRVRLLVEGEEEWGSPHLGKLLDQRPELRKADAALIEGGGVDPDDRPVIECGGRGMLMVELACRTLSSDIHSSAAVLLDNAAERLIAALATLHDDDGAITLDGFMDDVRKPNDADREHVRKLPTTEIDEMKSVYGAKHFRLGVGGADAVEAIAFQPTVNVQAIWAGYTGKGLKNVVPAEARARLDIRLVPDQSPDRVENALRAHLEKRGFGDVRIDRAEMSYRPWWTPMDDPLIGAAARASEAVTGKESLISPSIAGTIPMAEVCRQYNVPNVTLGAGRIDSKAHAPDENYRLEDAATAARITARFLDEFTRL
jgi:acetylornithine deacetylase/succinyl-diaminopimelate desuccinylase-like protein